MEYQLKKENCPVCETILDATSEQAVDLDFSLPDYCPDIERILKCRICPSIISKNISGDKLDIDGKSVIKLYYLDAKKQAVRVCEHTSPFSCSFTLKESVTDAIPMITLRTEYLNCRALTPRRLDIHGAFSVCAKVYRRVNQDYACAVEGDDIQQKTHTETVSMLKGMGQQPFSVTEVLDIGQGKGTPESILCSELNIRLGDSKAVSDKLMLKGEAILHILYVTDIETGTQDTMTFNIPINQVVDVQGITEDTLNEIHVSVLNYDVSLKSEYDENSTLVTLDARLSAAVYAYENQSVEVIDDVYSTAYELETVTKPVSYMSLVDVLTDSVHASEEVTVTENGISKMIDIWSDSVNVMTTSDNDKCMIKGKVNCGMFALDTDGVPFYAERAVEFVYEPQVSANGNPLSVHTQLVPTIGFRITGNNTVEIQADIDLCMAVFETHSCRAVVAVVGNEDNRRDKDQTAALTLYYADENESLWSIARNYCTSVEAIRQENSLDETTDTVSGMILIPM